MNTLLGPKTTALLSDKIKDPVQRHRVYLKMLKSFQHYKQLFDNAGMYEAMKLRDHYPSCFCTYLMNKTAWCLQDLPELCDTKPSKYWIYGAYPTDYWFAPYDYESRIACIKQAIALVVPRIPVTP